MLGETRRGGGMTLPDLPQRKVRGPSAVALTLNNLFNTFTYPGPIQANLLVLPSGTSPMHNYYDKS